LPPVRLFFDAQSNLLFKLGYSTRVQGAVYAEETFGDYRLVDGVNVPFKASMVRGGMTLVERVLAQVTINPPLAPETFAHPAR
jgi:hypothetical protein